MQTEYALFEIATLDLTPGDCLIVKTERHLSKEQTAYIEAACRLHVPDGCDVMVLGGGLTVEVLKKSDR